MDIAEVLKRAKAPERTEEICLRGDLFAEHVRLDTELRAAQLSVSSMADGAKTSKLAAQIRALEDDMKAETAAFRLRSMTGYDREQWFDKHLPREGRNEPFNTSTGQPSLVAASCVDPQMSVEQAEELFRTIGAEQFGKLSAAAFGLSFGSADVPFSVAASVTLRGSEQKQ